MMKYTVFILIWAAMASSCGNNRDTFAYTCRCTNKTTGAADTVYAINVPTSGEAGYTCRGYGDTANVYGKNISCKID